MFGFSELLVILTIAFLILGPEEFPKATRNFLKLLNHFKKILMELKTEVSDVHKETQDALLDGSQGLKNIWSDSVEDLKMTEKDQKSLLKQKTQRSTDE